MAAQEAVQGLHSIPSGSNGYDYGYPPEGPYANHHYHNPYLHYQEQPQHVYGHAQQHGHQYGHQAIPGHEAGHLYPQHQPHNPHMPGHYGHPMDGMSHHHHHHPPPGQYSMMPGPNHHAGVYKEEPNEDPYSFVDDDSMLQGRAPGSAQIKSEGLLAGMNPVNAPKKRGRKKKVQHPELMENGEMAPMTMDMMPLLDAEGQPGKRKYTKSEHYKQRRRHDRFNGMTEEEVRARTLPDHLTSNLDVVIIGINPGLFAAYKGHHYAGPGNHFWKCLYLAGLVPEPMTADDDFKLLHFGIGFTNMVARATKGSADLTRKEIREGGRLLLEKLQQYRPKIAVFNGKGIYEVFSGKKEFTFGKQPECIDGTNTFIWVMPSSSARCAQLPRAMDKVPFYSALKKFRDYLNGLIPEIDENEIVFNDPKIRLADDGTEISEHLKVDSLSSEDLPSLVGGSGASGEYPLDDRPNLPVSSDATNMLGQLPPLGDASQIPVKKKRGRPKKIRIDGVIPVKQAPKPPQASTSSHDFADGPPKKKRGRPKKIRTDAVVPAVAQLDMNGSSLSSHSGDVQNGAPSASPAPPYMNQLPNPQQLHHPIEYFGRPPSVGGGPLSGLCNDGSPPLQPQQSTTSPQAAKLTSPRQPEPSGHALAPGPPSLQQIEPSNGPVTPAQQFSPAVHHSAKGPPPSLAFRPPAPAGVLSGAAYHPQHNQDVASKSLSGLESLVDQIPANLSEGEQQHQHSLQMHHQVVSNNFSHYTASQPSFSYPSPSFGHYAPQYSTAGSSGGGGGGFPSNSYSQGAPEHGFNGTNGPTQYPVPFAAGGPSTSQMNGHGMAGYPHSGYGQYPGGGGVGGGGSTAYPPYSAAGGFTNGQSYPYPNGSSSAGAPYSYPQTGYHGNHHDRPKNGFGGY